MGKKILTGHEEKYFNNNINCPKKIVPFPSLDLFHKKLKSTYPKDTAIIYLALGIFSLDDSLNSFLALFLVILWLEKALTKIIEFYCYLAFQQLSLITFNSLSEFIKQILKFPWEFCYLLIFFFFFFPANTLLSKDSYQYIQFSHEISVTGNIVETKYSEANENQERSFWKS